MVQIAIFMMQLMTSQPDRAAACHETGPSVQSGRTYLVCGGKAVERWIDRDGVHQTLVKGVWE